MPSWIILYMEGKMIKHVPLHIVLNSFLRGENSDLAWESLFDVVIVGACKPAFLKENHLSIFKVDR